MLRLGVSTKCINIAHFSVAIAPNEFVMFVSKLYGGRVSGVYITNIIVVSLTTFYLVMRLQLTVVSLSASDV